MVAELTHEWLDGPSLLAAPIVHEAGNYSTYLPRGHWFELNSSVVHAGPKTLTGEAPLSAIPIFVRAPAVLPLAPLLQHTGALPGGPLDVHVYAAEPGEEGAPEQSEGDPAAASGGAAAASGGASFTVYEDDGETMGYASAATRMEHVRTTTYTYVPRVAPTHSAPAALMWTVEGSAPGGFTHVRVTLFRPNRPPVVEASVPIGRGGKVLLPL